MKNQNHPPGSTPPGPQTIRIELPNGRLLELPDLDADQLERAKIKFKEYFEKGLVTFVDSGGKQESNM